MTKFRRQPDIYIHREVITYSREKRPMEMITFTKDTKRKEEREALIEGLFPEANGDPESRPHIFDKKTIFLSCRVHPGETPASYVLDGIMKFLLKQTEQAKTLLEKFVFKVVPQLNPDGVYRGYWRLDTMAQNLNRFYTNPHPEHQPTIFGVKKVIVQQYQYKKLDVYVDLHAHASKRGCFMFGNNLKGEDMLKNMLLPRLVSLNSLNFDWMECAFSEGMMKVKDKKDGLTREGCGRVSIMQACGGLPNCYTLECNYASGRCINHISQKLNVETGQVEPEIAITDAKNRYYTEYNGKENKRNAPPYTIEVFEDVGRAFCIGLLDFYECNPVTRLTMSVYKNLEGVKNDLLAKN
jgi:cytosolic carboxypeptidase protein 5